MFWTLVFPLVLGTLYYFSFGIGSENIERMKEIPVALVQEGNGIFETFLEQLDGETVGLQVMEEEQALEALKTGEIDGIFYSAAVPKLTVAGMQINESILGEFLTAYLQNQKMMEEIGKKNPAGLLTAMKELTEFPELTEAVSTGGKSIDDTLSYFFALIGMTCLFGAFSGMTSASNLRADQSALAARRSIIPVHRFTMVVGELLAVFTVQFLNCCVLLCYLYFILGIPFGEKWIWLLPVCGLGSMTGVAIGILIGCSKLSEGIKNGVLVISSLFMSFLAGLMYGNMKDIVEHHAPIINRINPAALISDAFYSISIYENPARYQRNLLTLAVITLLLVWISYGKLRRERYDTL